jgi:hypothetical protein
MASGADAGIDPIAIDDGMIYWPQHATMCADSDAQATHNGCQGYEESTFHYWFLLVSGCKSK